MLHRVVAISDKLRVGNPAIEISPAFLEALLESVIAKGHEIVSLDLLYEYLHTGKQPRKKFACFTFDDGYVDTYTIAYPIFKKYEAPFTVFITTNFPEKKAVIWWYLLEDLLVKVSSLGFSHDGIDYQFPISTRLQKEVAFHVIANLITSADEQGREELLQNLFAANGLELSTYSTSLSLSWEQIKTLSGDPQVTIGAHTKNHFALSQIAAKTMQREIGESKQLVESHIQKPVEHFAYPFGNRATVSRREVDAVKEVGFKTACTTLEGNVFGEHKAHLESLPRIGVWGYRQDLLQIEIVTSGCLPALRERFAKVLTI